VRHPVLYGEYELTIDEKSRLLVPSDVRRAIPPEFGESFFVVMGTNRVPWLYAERHYEELAMQAPADVTPDDDQLMFDQLHFGMARKISPDKQGRVLIPDKTLKRAAIGREVTLVGARDHLELWNREDWEVRREELYKRQKEIADRAKLARRQDPPQGSGSPDGLRPT